MRFWLFAMWLGLVLPIALGPATSTVTRWLGGEPEHHCLCGMKRGTCGCAACAKLEAQRRDASRSHTYVTIRSTCEDDDGVVQALRLPIASPNTMRLVIAEPASEVSTEARPMLRDSQFVTVPSTRPPRA